MGLLVPIPALLISTVGSPCVVRICEAAELRAEVDAMSTL
jgi:hypothetical protein